jgi:tRNA(Ile2) C34 agmatinyltransferase TiaS
MAENHVTEAAIAKSGAPAGRKKAAARSIKSKSSAWYQGAVRSIGITKERVLEQISHRPQRKGKIKAKVVRVAAVIIDQIVACPSCDNPMRLSDMRKFECKQCGREVTAEEALRALEMSERKSGT